MSHLRDNASTQSTPSVSLNNTNIAPNCGEIEKQKNDILGVRQLLREQVQQHSRLKPWVTYRDIAIQWLVISCTIAVAIYSSNWLVWLVAIVVIASRQHALMVLGHEASHYRISPNRNINDFVGDVFCLLPLLLCLKRWQHEHLRHHRYANTAQDPYWDDFNHYSEWAWPKSKGEAITIFVRDLLGLNIKTNLEAAKRWSPFGSSPIRLAPQDIFRAVMFNLILILSLTVSNGWFYFGVLWLLPLLTVSMVFIRMRTLAEHIGIEGKDGTSGIDATRHVDANWLERMTICPLAINYHIDHHIFPSIPYYSLPEFHQLILENELYKKHAHICQGYFGKDGVLKEIIKN